MEKYLTPKNFLQFGGIAFLVIGVAGYLGIIGPTQGLLGSFWQFSSRESLLHLLLGAGGVAAAYMIPKAQTLRTVVGAVTGIALLRVLMSFFPSLAPAFVFTNVANTADTILYLVVALWGFAVYYHRK